MQPQIRITLRKAINHLIFKEKKTNWYRIKNIDVKKEWGMPVAVRTLYKIAEEDDYNTLHRNRQKALLSYFNKPFNDSFGIITLIEPSIHEKNNIEPVQK